MASKAHSPTTSDEEKLARVHKYLNATNSKKLVCKPNNLNVVAYADASFSSHFDSKGHTGIIINFGDGNGCVFAKSVKQRLVARSSTEAELIALDETVSYVLWFREILEELGFTQQGPTTIWQDNKSTIQIAERGSGNLGKTRHIKNKYFMIKQHIDGEDIALKYLPTEQMTADILTKPLTGKLFKTLAQRLMND